MKVHDQFFPLLGVTLMATLMLCAGCRLAPGNSAKEASTRVHQMPQDPLLYGVCLGISSDSLLFFTDEGDTLWLPLAYDLELGGALTKGHRFALMLRPDDNKVVRAVNTSMLIGDWVEPDPVSEGNVKGFMLSSGGNATSINIEDMAFESWNIFEGRLLLHGAFVGSGNQTFTDTFTIVSLLADSLMIEGSGTKHFMHRMRPGELNYENTTYQFEEDPEAGVDYSPESEDVQVSPDILEEGPVY